MPGQKGTCGVHHELRDDITQVCQPEVIITLSIPLSPETERRLSCKARSQGIDLATLAAHVLEAEARRLARDEPLSKPNQATLELLAQ